MKLSSITSKGFEESPNEHISYSYDELGRLVEARELNIDQVSKDVLSLNQSQSIVRSYDYDKRGNQTNEYVDGLLNKTFTFDATNMLYKVVDFEKGELENQYNGLGFRVSSTRPEEKTEYLCDLSRDCYNLLERTINEEKENFIYDKNVISMSKAGSNYYYLQDELGSPMYMTGTDGALVSSYAFDDFGRNIDPFTGNIKKSRNRSVNSIDNFSNNHAYTTDGNIIQPFAFTGYQEEVSELKFAHARFYDANTGRFQSEDRVKGFIHRPFTLNHYNYCFDNSIGFSDKNGNLPDWIEDAWDGACTLGGFAWDMACDYVDEKVSDYTHEIFANPLFVFLTQEGLCDDFYDTFGFVEDRPNGEATGVYHAKFDCWQQYFGYNDMYDMAFELGTSMNRAKFEFSVKDEDGNVKNYILWGWKGDYLNLGAGGEFGIYEEQFDVGGKKHYKVNQDLALPMTLQIVDSSGNVIIDYDPSSPQWWITGFNSNYQGVNSGDLNMRFTIDFSSNPDMYEAFIHSAAYLYNQDMWTIDPNNKYILIFTWEGDKCIG